MRAPVVLIAGGGTGGHVFPALAVAKELRERGARVEFVGTARGFEARLVPQQGYRLHVLPVRGLVGKSPLERARSASLLPVAVARALLLMRRLSPDVALGVGGYASGPALLAARLLRVPIALHEQNAIPGLTNRSLARLATTVAVSFEASRAHFRRPVVVTGNPAREAFFAIPPPSPGEVPHVLVFGGSQGSHVINRALTDALPLLAGRPVLFVHQTGERDLPWVRAAYDATPFRESARVVPFLDDMPGAFAEADLVISRAGATTAAELAAAGRGALLVPFAASAGGHQEANAYALADKGAAELLLERDLSGASLATRLLALVDQPGRLIAMGAAARTLARPEAARDVARLVLELASARRAARGGD